MRTYAGQHTYLAPEPEPDRGVRKLTFALLLFLSLLALFASLVLFQLTSAGTAKPALRRSVAALTEVDALIDGDYADLQQRAAIAAPGSTLELRGFPIAVPLTPAEAQSISRSDLRARLLDQSADAMYAHGTAPLRASASGSGSIGMFSVTGLVDHGLGFLRSRNHDILRLLTYALAAVSAVFAAGLVSQCRGFGRLGAVGVVTLAAAVPVLAAGLLARLYMSLNDGGGTEYTKQSFAAIGRDLAAIPIRDGAAMAALGIVMIVLGIALSAWADRRAPSRFAAARTELRP